MRIQKLFSKQLNECQKKKFMLKDLFLQILFFLKNRDKFNVILGMYHDQVLTPIKTLFEYDAINITMGFAIFEGYS